MLGCRGPGRAQRGDPAGAPVRPRAGAQPAHPSASAARAYHRRPRPAGGACRPWAQCMVAPPHRRFGRAVSAHPRGRSAGLALLRRERRGVLARYGNWHWQGRRALRELEALPTEEPLRLLGIGAVTSSLTRSRPPLTLWITRRSTAADCGWHGAPLHLANRRAQSIQVPLKFGPLCCPLLRLLESSL